jgi:hypothetical protein
MKNVGYTGRGKICCAGTKTALDIVLLVAMRMVVAAAGDDS